jgi:hypothetical protein
MDSLSHSANPAPACADCAGQKGIVARLRCLQAVRSFMQQVNLGIIGGGTVGGGVFQAVQRASLSLCRRLAS